MNLAQLWFKYSKNAMTIAPLKNFMPPVHSIPVQSKVDQRLQNSAGTQSYKNSQTKAIFWPVK